MEAPKPAATMERQRLNMSKVMAEIRSQSSLNVDSMSFRIPNTNMTMRHVGETNGTQSWQYKVLSFLHTVQVQSILMGLLFLDVVILFIEVFLMAQYPVCSIVERDALSCCPITGNETMDHHALRFLAEEDDSHHEYCPEGLSSNMKYEAACDEHKWKGVHLTEDILFFLTILILTTFMIDLNVEMIALGPKVFFRQVFFLVDYVIVATSLSLEATFHTLGDEIVQNLVGLLVIGRLWRFIRIGHGIVELCTELENEKFNHLLAYTEEIEEILKENGLDVPETASIRAYKGSAESLLSQIEREHRAHRVQHHNQIPSIPPTIVDDDEEDKEDN